MKAKELEFELLKNFNFIYDWMPLFANLFNSIFVQKFSHYSSFFKTVHFWQKYTNEFEFRGKNVLLKDLNLKCPIRQIMVTPLEIYFLERHNYKIYRKNDNIIMEIGGLKFTLPFPFGIFELLETWHAECYGSFDPTDDLVVDIGAFIGDTALYFAKKGAKRVIGFEPSLELFEIALKNVDLNNCGDKIELRNVAVGAVNGTKPFMFNLSWPGSSSVVRGWVNKAIYNTKVVSLASILEEFGHVGLLKVDCEGAEHDIIPQAYKEKLLKNIDKIVMEVHGSPLQIPSLLMKAGFKIKLTQTDADEYLLLASKA